MSHEHRAWLATALAVFWFYLIVRIVLNQRTIARNDREITRLKQLPACRFHESHGFEHDPTCSDCREKGTP